MYVPGQLSDVENVLVDIGTGYYVDMASIVNCFFFTNTYLLKSGLLVTVNTIVFFEPACIELDSVCAEARASIRPDFLVRLITFVCIEGFYNNLP